MIDPTVSMTYMLAGVAVVLIVLGAYLASLLLRTRSLRRDLQVLKDLRDEK